MSVMDERWFRECGQPEHVREVWKYTVSLGTTSQWSGEDIVVPQTLVCIRITSGISLKGSCPIPYLGILIR